MEDILVKLKERIRGRVVIVGIGNTLRGDDGIGSYVASNLGKIKENTLVIDAGDVPENFLNKIIDFRPDCVMLIDAVEMNRVAGECTIIETAAIKDTTLSTHNFSLKLLAEFLNEHIKTDVFMLGVQPKSIKLGSEFSKEVTKTSQQVINVLKEILGD